MDIFYEYNLRQYIIESFFPYFTADLSLVINIWQFKSWNISL